MPTCSVEIAKIYIIAIKENQSPSIQNVVPAKNALLWYLIEIQICSTF